MPAAAVQQALTLALQCHEAGQLLEAEALYRQILAAQPDHAVALHRLGLIAHQAGHFDRAVELIQKSLAAKPENPAALCDLGEAFRLFGRLDDAIAAYRRALGLQPDFPEAHNNLGTALAKQGHTDKAVAAYRRALEFRPSYAEAYYNLGNAVRDLGQLDEAVAAYRHALELKPDFATAHNNLGNVLRDLGQLDDAAAAFHFALQSRPNYALASYNLANVFAEQGRFDEALAGYRRALALRSDFPEAYFNMAKVLRERGQLDEAIACYQRIIALSPNSPETYNHLGVALSEQCKFPEAVAAFQKAIALDPGNSEAQGNLGGALAEHGLLDEAAQAYRQALALNPENRSAKSNYSLLLLLRGDFERGWPLNEARWNEAQSAERNYSQPRWQGEPLEGKRVFIHAEQGFGDSIQFIRYASLVAAQGGRVVVGCQRRLLDLFRTAKGVDELVAVGDLLPPFDVHLPMLSLPLVFGTTLDSIPRETPYLSADPVRRERWRQRLGAHQSRWRVGLAWAGKTNVTRLRKRHLSLDQLRPVLNVEHVELFSLQVEGGTEQLAQFSDADRIVDHTRYLQDFAETAALMSELDLIISVDTAAAHLAGALGLPVWTLLPFVPDWRWGLAGDATPWYPTMRLFRQPAAGHWEAVVARVADELRGLSLHAGA